MTDLTKLTLQRLADEWCDANGRDEWSKAIRAEFRRRDTREAALVRAAREAATNWANDLHDRNRLADALAAYPEAK